jgi:hypothetical protein
VGWTSESVWPRRDGPGCPSYGLRERVSGRASSAKMPNKLPLKLYRHATEIGDRLAALEAAADAERDVPGGVQVLCHALEIRVQRRLTAEHTHHARVFAQRIDSLAEGLKIHQPRLAVVGYQARAVAAGPVARHADIDLDDVLVALAVAWRFSWRALTSLEMRL